MLSIATAPRYRGGATPFQGLLNCTLYTYLIMLSAKQEGIHYHFLRPGIDPGLPGPLHVDVSISCAFVLKGSLLHIVQTNTNNFKTYLFDLLMNSNSLPGSTVNERALYSADLQEWSLTIIYIKCQTRTLIFWIMAYTSAGDTVSVF